MDKWLKACETHSCGNHRIKAAGIVAMIMGITIMAWLAKGIPADYERLLMVTFRQLYLLCVILTAIWFGTRGVMIAAGVITLLYSPIIITYAQNPYSRPELLDLFTSVGLLWLVAISSGALVGQLRTMLLKLAETREDTLMAIICALDRRELDSRLEAHSVRVRQYAVYIARRMQLPQRRIALLSQAALLHDIGKIGVPDSILIKSSSLNDDEWEHMATHSDKGYRILTEIPAMEDIAPIVRAHHERWDGKGYPQGISGEEIPIEARIFGVADAFDAMLTDRPYRRALSFDEARRRIIEGAGTQFDPEVVEVFKRIPLAAWQKLAYIQIRKPVREVAV